MSLNLEFRPGVARIAQAAYRKGDLALSYAVEPSIAPRRHDIQAGLNAALGIRPPRWLAIADTLVLVFSGEHANLVSFDAYTNIALWKRIAKLDVPEIDGTGSLHLAAPPRETDRVDLRISPQYEYAETEAHLRIGLGRRGTHHYRVSSCLVVGTDAKGIATLDVTDLRLEE
jgi:hypothetical protein